ncbi:MAG: hypothetical protein U0Y68_05475 [Blastocatellia bacterium]
MPLAELQTALGTMIAEHAAAGQLSTATCLAISQLPLTPTEHAWLAALPAGRGFWVTCDIQRWWRETRLRDTARLTLAALGTEQAAAQLTAYLSAHLCESLFFLPETFGFLQFVADSTTQPILRAIAQFEAALLQARETAVRVAESASIEVKDTWIEFCAPPEEVLAALLQGFPLPAPTTERFPVLVSARLPQLWQAG